MRRSGPASSTLRHAGLTGLVALSLSAGVQAAPRGPVTLADALDYFHDVTRLNLVVDWKAIETAGVSRETPVSLRLTNVRVRVALQKTLDAAAPGRLTFYVDGSVVHVTTVEAADAVLVTRVYPVGDLLVDVPDFEGPDFNLAGSGNRGSRSGGGSGGGGGSTGNLFANAAAAARTEGATRAERAAALVELIQATVRPEVWAVNGGRATIRFFHDNLIVTAPPSVQALLD